MACVRGQRHLCQWRNTSKTGQTAYTTDMWTLAKDQRSLDQLMLIQMSDLYWWVNIVNSDILTAEVVNVATICRLALSFML